MTLLHINAATLIALLRVKKQPLPDPEILAINLRACGGDCKKL